MKHSLQILVFITTIFSSSFALSAGIEDVTLAADQVAKLNVDKAGSDARAAIRRSDGRLLAVYGFTLEVPGANQEAYRLREQYGLRILEGTSDALRGPADKLFNERARQYAEKYNQIILSEFHRSK